MSSRMSAEIMEIPQLVERQRRDQAASFYVFVERLARRRGLDADRPNRLSQVTVIV